MIATIPGSLALTAAAATPPYDLSRTEGMNCFQGSEEAQKLLAAQGVVVAAPEFHQIFEPYLESPLPVFVTPDSAWHTYHMLLEEGVKEMERAQSLRLMGFSRLLLQAARRQSAAGLPQFAAIADYASVGLAFQDRAHRQSLPAEQKRCVEGLLTGTAPVEAPIGFRLSPVQFRPQSFYNESPDLQDFYAARQWYAGVDFRLSNKRETLMALCVSWLVESNPELLGLWQQLSAPYDTFVAQPEDGTVNSYNRTAKAILGPEFGPAGMQAHLGELQKRLAAALPAPRINDQSLSPAEYTRFSEFTKGFRLLPARQLPCGVCFQNTVAPRIPNRTCPSGLDFFVASPALRSPAAVRALGGQFGSAVLQAVQTADCPPLPDSLYGQSMELLAKLQQPLPAGLPEPFRTEAWADLQLWTQLGAWSEQRHTWALYSKLGAMTSGIKTPPPGVVAPYPEFFAGLGKLARQTATAFEKTAAEQHFDAKTLAGELYAMEKLVRSNYNGMSEQELTRMRPKLDHYGRFIRRFYAAHQAEMGTNAWKLHSDLDERLKRVAETGEAGAEETKTLQMYFDTRQFAPPELRRLAGVCDRLAELARKQVAGDPLTHEEAQWVRNYGTTIKVLQGYDADTWLDEFPIISRIFHDQFTGSILYAGVARPQALYVILPYKGKLQLYWGAVLSYREFVRPEGQALDDKSWRELVSQGKAPAPPPFTRSFLRAEKTAPNQKRGSVPMASGLKPGQPARIDLKVKEVSLGPSPTRWVRREGWLTPSEDCRHVAYRARQEGKWRIFRDGAPGKTYDDVSYQLFSPDSEHLAYLARVGDKWCVVLDGTEGPLFAHIDEAAKDQWPVVFSPDSAHLAYVATIQAGQQCVVVDGAQGPVFDKILDHSFSFSEKSDHFVYAGRRGGQAIVVKDGKEVLKAAVALSPGQNFGSDRDGDIFGPFLSADGSRLACAIQRNGKWVMVVDGVESRPWDSISDIDLEGPAAGFSPDGSHFTYVGVRGEKQFVVVDQKEYPGAWLYGAAFSPDGKHVAFVRATEKTEGHLVSSVVLDGSAGKTFTGEIKDLVFSPDGKRLAYKVSEGMANQFVVVHGAEVFDDYHASGDITFSPDGRHLAFLGNKYGRSFFVVDGQEYLKSEDHLRSGLRSSYFTFSPDSQRWAYIAEHNKATYAVISGTEYGPYDSLSAPDEDAYIYFSPDSRHFVFMATRENPRNNQAERHYLVVDGQEYEIQGASWLNGSILCFDSSTQLHGLVMGKDRISRLEVEISPK